MKQETIDAQRKWLRSFSEKPLSETDQAILVGQMYGALYEIEKLQKTPTKPVVDVKPRWCQMCGNEQPLKNTNEDALGRTNCAFCGAAIVRPQVLSPFEDANGDLYISGYFTNLAGSAAEDDRFAKMSELQGYVTWFETENVKLRYIIKQLIEAGNNLDRESRIEHLGWSLSMQWRDLANEWKEKEGEK